MPGPVCFILKGYPRLSESFIAQEIHALEQRGLEIRIVSLRHPTDRHRHPVHDEIRAPVAYLPEYLYREPLRVLRAWRTVRRWSGYRRVRARWLADWRRDPTPNRIRRFGQALVLAAELDTDIVALHAHFLHTPASVARYAAGLTGRPWSASAHAKDVWTIPEWEAREKLADCAWLTTCSAAACAALAPLAPQANAGETVSLIYHGLDLARFPPGPRPAAVRDGSDPAAPVRLLSVGRAVEKKGYPDLLRALAALPPDLAWRLEHIGGGPERERLRRLAAGLGLAERIVWRGALAQAEVLAAYRQADLFVLASRLAAGGDRDGLPNVLLEAQSQALACVATRVSGIPELISDGVNGLLVAPGDRAALGRALAQLIADPARRRTMGEAGQRRVAEAFALAPWIDRLAAKFGLPPAPAARITARA